MVRFEVFAIMAIRQHDVLVQEFVNLQVGRVTAIAMDENVACLRLERHQLHQLADLNPLPTVVVARPGGDAMEIRRLARRRQLAQFFPAKPQGILDQSKHPKIPFGRIEARCRPVAQDRKTGNQVLPGRETDVPFVSLQWLRHSEINSEARLAAKEDTEHASEVAQAVACDWSFYILRR